MPYQSLSSCMCMHTLISYAQPTPGAGRGGRRGESGGAGRGGRWFWGICLLFPSLFYFTEHIYYTISDMSVPLCLHITEVIPTCHNTLHVESVSVGKGRLSKLMMSWSLQAHGSARAVVSEAKIKFVSLSLLADSDLSDGELPGSQLLSRQEKFCGSYPPLPPASAYFVPLWFQVPSFSTQFTTLRTGWYHS